MAACSSGSTQQCRTSCTTEVQHANAEKRAGKLGASTEMMANAMKRCDVFATAEGKAACRTRIESQARLDASVGGSGVLRQSEAIVPAAPR